MMSMIASVLTKEEKRVINMIAEYQCELETLPKGSIRIKKNRERVYYYLSFRVGDKVVSKYVGKDEDTLASIREQLDRRKQVEGILKKLKEEYEQITKMEAVL